jgi:hypothetical protein
MVRGTRRAHTKRSHTKRSHTKRAHTKRAHTKRSHTKRAHTKKVGGKWSMTYKKSINCSRPKGFSQKQYCKYGRKTLKK